MAGTLEYATVDVFTSTRLAGNQLAVVLVPAGHELAQDKARMQAIAREFNYSETVFLHGVEGHPAEAEHGEWAINIFTVTQELPFAGHPTIGTSWFLAERFPRLQTATLKAGAGPLHITVERDSSSGGQVQATARIPFSAHQHTATLAAEELFRAQPRLRGKVVRPGQPVVSIVKGMTFALVEVNSRARLSEVQTTGVQPALQLDAAWAPSYCGVYFFFVERRGGGGGGGGGSRAKVHSRMVDGQMEDPATGSAASALAAYLSLWDEHSEPRADATTEYEIEQGADMGRRSSIVVRTRLDGAGALDEVVLGGTAVKVTEGVFYN